MSINHLSQTAGRAFIPRAECPWAYERPPQRSEANSASSLGEAFEGTHTQQSQQNLQGHPQQQQQQQQQQRLPQKYHAQTMQQHGVTYDPSIRDLG